MSSESPSTGLSISVERCYEFPVETVFDAWFDASRIGGWLFATPGGEMVRIEVDGRVGGMFTIVEKRGAILAEHFGRYREIDRPRHIAFDFWTNVEREPAPLTVDIAPTSTGCKLGLTLELAPKWAEYAEMAKVGWAKILQRLDETLRDG